MRLSSIAIRLGGILATAIGLAAIAVGGYSLYGLIEAHYDGRGIFSLLMFGCFLLGLGLPALAGGIAVATRPPTQSTDEIVVPRLALLASGSLMLVAAALMMAGPVLGYTAARPNAVGMAIFAGLGIAFIRSGRRGVD